MKGWKQIKKKSKKEKMKKEKIKITCIYFGD